MADARDIIPPAGTFYVQLRNEAHSIVGAALSAADAVALGSAIYQRSGEDFEIKSPAGEVIAVIGTLPVLPPADAELQLLSLEPHATSRGADSFTLQVNGQGFADGAVILFNNGDEATTFVSAQLLTTVVNPAMATVAISVPVAVRNPDGTVSNELEFEFE